MREEKSFKKVITGRSEGTGWSCRSLEIRVNGSSKVLLLAALDCVLDRGQVESDAIPGFHPWERAVKVPSLPVLSAFLFPNHYLLGQPGILLAVGNTWPPGFQQHNGCSSWSNELPDSGDSFPELNTSAYAGESGLPTWMDSLGEKKWKKKKEKKTPNRLYFKNNRKAISCDNLLKPLTKFIQERDWSITGFLESEF